MRTAVYLALVGAAAAADDCAKAGTTCTFEMCYAEGVKTALVKTSNKGCTAAYAIKNTHEKACLAKDATAKECAYDTCYPDVTTTDMLPQATFKGCAQYVDRFNCTGTVTTDCKVAQCSVAKNQVWPTCKVCTTNPKDALCWESSDSTKCQWDNVGCTAALCKDHVVPAELKAATATSTPAASPAEITAYNWSVGCNETALQNMLLKASSKYAGWDTINKANLAKQSAAKKLTAGYKATEAKDCKAPQTTAAEKLACKNATTAVTTNAAKIATQVVNLAANKAYYTANKDTYTGHTLTLAVNKSESAVKSIETSETKAASVAKGKVTVATAANAKAPCAVTISTLAKDVATCKGYVATIASEGKLEAAATLLAKNATTALANSVNQNAWHAGDLAAADETAAKAIQAADAKKLIADTKTQATACKAPATKNTPACIVANAAVTQQKLWKTENDKRVTSLEKAAKAATASAAKKAAAAKKAKAAAAKKSPAKKTKLTSAEKAADAKALVAAKAASTKAAAAVTATEAKQKSGDCLTTKKATSACKTLATTLATEKTTAATAAATVTAAEKAMPSSGSGATVGIVIACVAAVLCIGGGAAWYIKHKKGGESSENPFGDDLYTAFVDTEEA